MWDTLNSVCHMTTMMMTPENLIVFVFAGRKDLFPHQAHLCQPVSVRALEVIVQSQRNVLC